MADPAPSRDPLTEPGPWNAVAVGYDEEFFGHLPQLFDEALAIIEPPPTATVLDVGTGPGTFAVRLAPSVGRVVAIDFAERMIERLRKHLDEERITNIEALVMDGQALSFADASFDAVVSMFGWFLFADRAKSLAEIHRVVRPGGRVLVTSWAPIERNTVLGVGLQALREALPDLPRPSGPLPTQIPENCAAEMRAAGFADVRTKLVPLATNFDSVDDYWRMFHRASAPFAVLRKKLGEEAWPATAERIFACLRERAGSGPLKLQAEAIFTSGVR